MDISGAGAPESRKRSCDNCTSLASEGLAQESPSAKKAHVLGVEEEICSILGDSSLAIQLLDQNELDEVQEELVSDVMRSLEEELVSSDRISSSLSDPEEHFKDGSFHSFRDEDVCPAEAQTSTEELSTAEEERDNFELISFLDAKNEFISCSTFPAESSPCALVVDGNVNDGFTISEQQQTSGNYKSFDMGYLLAASDDELGILPSPADTDSLTSQTESVCDSFQGMDSSRSDGDSIILDPWFSSLDSNSELHLFSLANVGENYSNQEWFRKL